MMLHSHEQEQQQSFTVSIAPVCMNVVDSENDTPEEPEANRHGWSPASPSHVGIKKRLASPAGIAKILTKRSNATTKVSYPSGYKQPVESQSETEAGAQTQQ